MNYPTTICFLFFLSATAAAIASPQEDLAALRTFYQQRFPTLSPDDYSMGSYALDPIAKQNWDSLQDFPPYEMDIDEGKVAFEAPFANGKSYANCFEQGGIGIAGHFPYWNAEQQQVVTLELAINQCRKKNQEKPLPYSTGKMASILAYLTYTSRGKLIDVQVPNEKKALAAYEKGKAFYGQRRGQLDMACKQCHIDYAGSKLRSETLSPMLGHATHWPSYRTQKQMLGTLHWRFISCSQQVRAEIFAPQSEEYRNLEYYLTYMSRGLKITGPDIRR